jgi:hypothetical protein
MSSIAASDWWKRNVDWETPAGKLLRRFFASLPTNRAFRLALYRSAPLQRTLDRTWLSADVDLFSEDDEDLAEWIARAGLSREHGDFFIEPGFSLSFRTSPAWRGRAKTVSLNNVSITLPHPLDILSANSIASTRKISVRSAW